MSDQKKYKCTLKNGKILYGDNPNDWCDSNFKIGVNVLKIEENLINQENRTVKYVPQECAIKTCGPNTIIIRNEHKLIATIHPSGDVTLDGDPNEAAQIFWKFISETYKTRISELNDEVEKLKALNQENVFQCPACGEQFGKEPFKTFKDYDLLKAKCAAYEPVLASIAFFECKDAYTIEFWENAKDLPELVANYTVIARVVLNRFK